MYLKFGNDIRTVEKIQPDQFSSDHKEIVRGVTHNNGQLRFADDRWVSEFLGAGEEKAVFCVCDHNDRVFALELIDERTYLNGRFVGGKYFCDTTAPALRKAQPNGKSLIRLMFTGKVKAREYVDGYEWARFQYDREKKTWVDGWLTSWLRLFLGAQFEHYRARYKDVHERNVMFEIREEGKGVPVIAKDWIGKVRMLKVGLQPIDVR